MRRAAVFALLVLAGPAASQDASDLFLVQLQDNAGKLTAGTVTRLTNREGYNNQPSFMRGTPFILYTVIDSTTHADIWRYDLARRVAEPFTRTQPESEYSATLMPGGDRISVIRVERDSTQRLWSFDLNGSDARVVIDNVKPVGYHAWIDSTRVAVFVLGNPATLQIVDTRTGSAQVIARNIGRALQRLPGRHAVSFIQINQDTTRTITVYDADNGTLAPLIRTLPANEYHVWTPTGTLVGASGSSLYQWRPGSSQPWSVIGDIGVAGITRIAISADGRQLAIVGAHNQPVGQNPSPMTEQTRRHERIENKRLAGTRRNFNGPLDKPVEVFIPAGIKHAGALNLVVHFHGAGWLAEYAVSRRGKDHVSATVQIGSGSGIYDRAFSDARVFEVLLDSIRQQVATARAERVSFRSITLSGWSAGHGAIRAILRDSAHYGLIDGVLLLDGMHTGYVPEYKLLAQGGRLDTTNLTIWVRYARAAMAGRKRFLVTHSEIFPGTFASTTETAQYVLDSVGLRRQPTVRWGPLGMQQTSVARAGRFETLSYAGNAAPDHVDHMHALYYFLATLEKL
jgi:hypothetical protein